MDVWCVIQWYSARDVSNGTGGKWGDEQSYQMAGEEMFCVVFRMVSIAAVTK